MGKRWIQGAIKRPGALARKAKRAGKSVGGFIRSATKTTSRAGTRTKRQANLAKTLRKLARKK